MNKHSRYSPEFVIYDCLIENGRHLICEFPEACLGCIFYQYKGRGRKFILAAYQKYRSYERECAKL